MMITHVMQETKTIQYTWFQQHTQWQSAKQMGFINESANNLEQYK